jgi:selenocysteine lyase/cysteine desulfurase
MRRREALGRLSAAALFGLPAGAADGKAGPLPDPALLERDPERYWARVRDEQFLLPGWRAFLNNGSLGVAPRPVLAAVEAYLRHGASRVTDEYPRWGYETLEAHRAEMAAFLGCKTGELAFTHNATEAMNIVAHGLELKPGDEVLLTDQEHPGGRECWLKRARRDGILVREVSIPLPPASPEQLVERITGAIGPRTRVLSFSGITSPTGLVLPVREICEQARARGVTTVVDGAHMTGQVKLRLDELGCDFFAGSPHKWLFAPAGCGLLYIREEWLERLWPLVVTGGWDKPELKAARFMQVGTNERAIFEGLLAGKRFAEAIGPERIYARIHELARRVRAMAAARPSLELLTPEDDRLYAAMVAFRLKPEPLARLRKLAAERRIWLSGGEETIRISTHIHTRPSDIELFFATLEAAKSGTVYSIPNSAGRTRQRG